MKDPVEVDNYASSVDHQICLSAMNHYCHLALAIRMALAVHLLAPSWPLPIGNEMNCGVVQTPRSGCNPSVQLLAYRFQLSGRAVD